MEIDNQAVLVEETILSQGAEAKVYISTFHGKKCVIKERFVKKYRVQELDTKLTKQRMLNESRNLAKLYKIGVNTPYVLFVDLITRKIYMQYIENSVMMKNILRKIYENSDFSVKFNILLEKIVEFLARDLAKIHNNNVIHGDLTSSNLLMMYDQSENPEEDIINTNDFHCLFFIDFGLSFVSQHNEDKAVDLYVLRRAMVSSNPKSEEIVS